jgi:NifB/MoaA-like Fe-S oxidoreductase
VSVLDAVADWQEIFMATLGQRMLYAADEYYLMAGRPFPDAENYDGFGMHEDGIGMASAFEAEFNGRTEQPTGPQRGFFAAVDAPPNPASYTALRASTAVQPTPVALGPRPAAPIGILTGELGARVITPLVETMQRSDVRVLTVANDYFGGNTGVTGLLTGTDVSRVLSTQPHGHRYLLPDVCLSDEGRFLDGLTVDQLPRAVEIVATNGIALRRALAGN